MSFIRDIHEQTLLQRQLLEESKKSNYILIDIDLALRRIERKLFPVPTQLRIELEGDPMATAKTYPLNTMASGTVAETPPPEGFNYAAGSVVFSQSGGAGQLTDDQQGRFTYTPPLDTAEVVTVTASDQVSNPDVPLSNTAVLTFSQAAVLPTQLDIVLD